MPRKHDRKGNSVGSARHVRFYYWFLNTEAWQSLDAVERALYLELAARYAGINSNNGRIAYSVRDAAAALHVSKSTAARAFSGLEERGFIVCTQKGGFSWKVRHATLWRLTEHPCDVTHALPTKEFARWTRKSQSPERDRAVPDTGQHGPASGTTKRKNSSDGISHGTVST